MKRLFRHILLLVALSISLSSFTACEKTANTQDGQIDETNPPASKNDTQTEKKKANYPPLPEAIATSDIKAIDGGSFNIKDRKGKVVLLNLWATWCVPCIAEMPHLIEMQEKYKDQGFEVIGLNIGDGDGVPESKEKIEAFAEKQKLNYELAWADNKLFGEFVRLTNAPVVPQTVIVNKEGRMTGVFTGGGAKNFAQMKEVVEKTINE